MTVRHLTSSLLAGLLTLAACSAPAKMEIPVQKVAGTREAHQPIDARLYLPAGAGPFPAVILLHGCGGLGLSAAAQDQPLMEIWARRLNDWGYAALVTDSFTPRGVTSVCAAADQPKVTPLDRTGDVVSAALYLRTVPQIDASRIGVIGSSHGGATAARLVVPPSATLFPGLLRGVVDYYGGCTNPGAYSGTPLLVLAGEADDWGHPAETCTAFGRAQPPGKPFQIVTYPGVVHAFDNPALRKRYISQGHALQYDAAAAEDSFLHVHAFLDQYVAAAR